MSKPWNPSQLNRRKVCKCGRRCYGKTCSVCFGSETNRNLAKMLNRRNKRNPKITLTIRDVELRGDGNSKGLGRR